VTEHWLLSLAVAILVALVATPVARQVALSVGLVDRPGPTKSHSRPTAYLGGVAIAVAVLSAGLAGPYPRLSEVATVCVLVLVATGLLDDARTLSPAVRLCVEGGCATAVILAGAELRDTRVGVLDVAVTLLLLVGMANAMNLLDNLDGLAAGVTAAGAAGVLALTVLRHDGGTAVSAASLVGACLGFLVFNARRATIFMGDAGSLFLGFLLAVMAIEAGSSLPHTSGVVFPLLVLALPITDTTTVIAARLRNGRPVVRGGKDHLSHRLARAGLGPGGAVAVLVAIEAFMAGLGVADGRQLLAPWVASALGASVLVALVTVAGRVRVYGAPVRRPLEQEGSGPSTTSPVAGG
jgi:UDP-GlcNAc:undecaprenyl-phosphate GlcNAc-1-phosphate transferase